MSIELHKFWFFHDDLMHCVGRTSRKYALNRVALPSLWHVQEGTNLTQIEVVALEEANFLLSKKPKCPLVNPIRDNISAFMKQPPGMPFRIFFGDSTSTPVYKPSNLDAWPKSKNAKKVSCLDILKLSIMQANKWEVGRTLEATLLTPSNIPPLGYGWIYNLLLGPTKNCK